MNPIKLAAVLLLAMAMLASPAARADIVVLKDPDAWMQETVERLKSRKFDEVTRDFFRLIDKPVSEPFAASLRALGSVGDPAFIEKATDSRFGDVLRQVIWVGLYGQSTYVYFSFTIKKARGGYAVTNFQFKDEPGQLFPAGYYTPD